MEELGVRSIGIGFLCLDRDMMLVENAVFTKYLVPSYFFSHRDTKAQRKLFSVPLCLRVKTKSEKFSQISHFACFELRPVAAGCDHRSQFECSSVLSVAKHKFKAGQALVRVGVNF